MAELLHATASGLLETTAIRLAVFLGIISLEDVEAFELQCEAKLTRGEELNAAGVCTDFAERIHDGALELIDQCGNVPLKRHEYEN